MSGLRTELIRKTISAYCKALKRMEDDTMTHLIADEKLGGVQREFIEVDRKAVVGDYVYVSKMDGAPVSEIAEVIDDDYDGDNSHDTIQLADEINHEYLLLYKSIDDIFEVLEPTDIVVIEGERYRLEERLAEVGEKVLIDAAESTYGKYSNGDVVEAISRDCSGIMNPDFGTDSSEGNPEGFIADEEYRVLVLVDSEPAEPSPDIHGLIANLVRRTTELERTVGELVRAKSSLESRLADVQSNVQTFAEQTESNTQDIAQLGR